MRRTPPPTKALLHPRRVRGGVRIEEPLEGPGLWAAQRWLRLAEQAAIGVRMAEGLEYARLGQTKRWNTGPGKVEASIQGRADRPYAVSVVLTAMSDAAWEPIVGAMSEGALYAAKLLTGELPSNIEDVFRPRGLKLFPDDPGELSVSCSCAEHQAARAAAPGGDAARSESGGASPATTDARWCKHVCCLMHLVASRLAREPFLVFALRGLEGRELIERVRERRAAAGAPPGDRVPVYVQHVAGVTDNPGKPLEECVANFWDAGPGLGEIDIPIAPPPVSHPLLRRLGPSPFQAAFPLVGLLASCYEVISRDALARGESDEPPPEP